MASLSATARARAARTADEEASEDDSDSATGALSVGSTVDGQECDGENGQDGEDYKYVKVALEDEGGSADAQADLLVVRGTEVGATDL